MSTTSTYSTVWVCTDCYFAHHYGATSVDREPTDDETHAWHGGYLRGHALPNMTETDAGLMVTEWFAGESDTPCDREPLSKLDGWHAADATCSDHQYNDQDDEPCKHCGATGWDDGNEEFSWRGCDGCTSTLGGSRYRLAVWQ